jgi:hypothetical protein
VVLVRVVMLVLVEVQEVIEQLQVMPLEQAITL